MEKQEPQQIQMSLDPNLYAITNVSVLFDEENFQLMIASGNQGRQFHATPKHAKRIYLLLKQQIENYEKQFGELKTELPKPSQNKAEFKDETKIGF